MPFVIGDENINKLGRPPGALGKSNRVSRELKESLEQIVNKSTKQIELDLLSLPPDLRVKYYIELIKFILPQQRAINYQNDSAYLEESIRNIDVHIIRGE